MCVPLFPQPLMNFDSLRRHAREERSISILETLNFTEEWDVFIDELFKSHRYVDEKDIPWLEKNIPILLSAVDRNGVRTYRSFGLKLLDWYIFQSVQDEGKLALRFTIDLYRKNALANESEFPKKIFRKIKNSDLYWSVPDVDWLICKCLRDITFAEHDTLEWYLESSWNLAERALRQAIAYRDASILPILQQALADHKAGKVKLHDNEHDPFCNFDQAGNLAILREAVKSLTEIRNGQQHPLTVTVGSAIKEAAELRGQVFVKVRYPDSTETGTGGTVKVRLETECSDDEQKLKAFLKERHPGDAGVFVHTYSNRCHKHLNNSSVLDENLEWKGTMTPLPGITAKFELRFSVKGQEIATYTGYMRSEKAE